MDIQKIFEQVLDNLDVVIKQGSPLGILLWQEFLKIHPADIAEFMANIQRSAAQSIFLVLPKKLKLKIFLYLSDSMKVFLLGLLPSHDRSYFLSSLPLDELTDLFDELSDDELKRYLKLIHKKDREKVLSLMQFDPESAGGLMHTDVLTLMSNFTVEKSIKILQRLRPTRELHRIIYITNQDNELLGYINLEDLVLKDPKTRIESILRENILIVEVSWDQEKVASSMIKYKVSIAPVISETNIFLGIIDSAALVDVLEQQAAEDVYKISGVRPIKNTYFETPFLQLFYQRSSILVILLLMQTFSALIVGHYEALLTGFIILFKSIGMIGSTGGNTSSQTSALVIQGLVSGEITDNNVTRFVKREFLMSLAIGVTLGIVSFIRIYVTNPGDLWANLSVAVSLGVIVLVSVILGSIFPIMLKRLGMDPALSAGPFLATIMDICGILIYCFISKLILGF